MYFELKKRLRRFLANQVAFQFCEEMPEMLPVAIAPKVRLALGVPVPLGRPLNESILHQSIDSHVSTFLQQHSNILSRSTASTALDIGCGGTLRNLFEADNIFGCDIRASSDGAVIAVDLFHQPIPFPDNYFDYLTAYDFIEHVPRVLSSNVDVTRFPFVELMNEVYRVLKPGGIFFSKTPAFPSKEAFQDPTHVNIITEDTFPMYFCNDSPNGLLASMYGFRGAFSVLSQEWCNCCLLSLLRRAS
jgi:SAM-dependent methyltransferase